MTIPVVDFLVSAFFIGALAVAIKFYQRAQVSDKEGLRNLTFGLAILAGISLFELANTYHLFASIPVLAEPLVSQLLTWIGMITGIVFVALGVSRRFSSSDETTISTNAIVQRSEILKHIVQFSQVEKRTSVLLQKTLQELVSNFRCAHGALYVRSKAGEMRFVVADGSAMRSEAMYQSIPFELQPDQLEILDIPSQAVATSQVVEELSKPDVLVPVATESGIVAAFLLWRESSAVWNNEDLQTMKLASGIIARNVDMERLRLKHEFFILRDQWRSTTESVLTGNESLRDQLPAVLSHIQSQLPVDLLSIGIVTSQQLLRRISISQTGGVLDEHRINLYRRPSHLTAVLERNQAVLVHEVSRDRSSASDEFLKRNNIQSFISVPLMQKGSQKFILTVAAHAATEYSRKHVSMVEAVAPIVRELVQRELWKEIDAENRNRLLVVSDLLQTVAANRSVHEVIEQVGQTIGRLVNTSLVRISMLDTDGISLRSRYLTCTHATHVSTPVDGHMILSVLPQHAKLIAGELTGVLHTFLEKNEISESEAVLAFAPNIKQMLLVPVQANGHVVGIVGCADMRADNRAMYSQEDIALVQALAGVIGTVTHRIMAADMLYSHLGGVKAEKAKIDSVHVMRPAVRSSLSGIVGSLEMLQTTPAAQDEHVQRYLSIIDRSTQRMSKIFETELSSSSTE